VSATQHRLDFASLDSEFELTRALVAAGKSGTDLWAGITDWTERKARARISIIVNKLEEQFAQAFERVYREPLRKGKAA
jgi:hypothetical protein